MNGLFTYTALTLLVLPALYLLFGRILVPKKAIQPQDIQVTQESII
jgi:hypothetical protein